MSTGRLRGGVAGCCAAAGLVVIAGSNVLWWSAVGVGLLAAAVLLWGRQ